MAKVVLKDVFCTDPACSIGCQKESVIRPNSIYTSELCYNVAAFYDERKNDNDDRAKSRVATDPQTREYDFSFELNYCKTTKVARRNLSPASSPFPLPSSNSKRWLIVMWGFVFVLKQKTRI